MPRRVRETPRVVVALWANSCISGGDGCAMQRGLLGLVALEGDQRVGLLTYVFDGEVAEIVTIDALREGIGAGRALIEAFADAARLAGVRRLVVWTSNDTSRAAP